MRLDELKDQLQQAVAAEHPADIIAARRVIERRAATHQRRMIVGALAAAAVLIAAVFVVRMGSTDSERVTTRPDTVLPRFVVPQPPAGLSLYAAHNLPSNPPDPTMFSGVPLAEGTTIYGTAEDQNLYTDPTFAVVIIRFDAEHAGDFFKDSLSRAGDGVATSVIRPPGTYVPPPSAPAGTGARRARDFRGHSTDANVAHTAAFVEGDAQVLVISQTLPVEQLKAIAESVELDRSGVIPIRVQLPDGYRQIRHSDTWGLFDGEGLPISPAGRGAMTSYLPYPLAQLPPSHMLAVATMAAGADDQAIARWGLRDSRSITVRGHEGVTGTYLLGPGPVGSNAEQRATVLTWQEADGVTVSVVGVDYTVDDLLAFAEQLRPADDTEWSGMVGRALTAPGSSAGNPVVDTVPPVSTGR
jgi:hypothetical protein